VQFDNEPVGNQPVNFKWTNPTSHLLPVVFATGSLRFAMEGEPEIPFDDRQRRGGARA
jgi:hypothetical protein